MNKTGVEATLRWDPSYKDLHRAGAHLCSVNARDGIMTEAWRGRDRTGDTWKKMTTRPGFLTDVEAQGRWEVEGSLGFSLSNYN